ncbi:MAG: glycerol-3-phosphate 1-O-acyltransferase PlsY [Flavobacteriales bacterium]|nr:glycerol-3-phosphate 1-O-acyltransferase PlsY [Flavobacteriales bacterium]
MRFEFDFLPFLLAYLLGSIPTSVWVGQVFYGIDIRDHGSGNAGATNTMRILGKKAGIPVLLFDVAKGIAAVYIPFLLPQYTPGNDEFVSVQLITGLGALIGHIFPVYVGFRGGKGIATLLGVVIAMHTPAAMVAIVVFTVVLLITGYVSLSSIIASLSFPISLITYFQPNQSAVILFSFFVVIMVLITHQKNLERLLRGQESKARLRKNTQQLDEDDDK